MGRPFAARPGVFATLGAPNERYGRDRTRRRRRPGQGTRTARAPVGHFGQALELRQLRWSRRAPRFGAEANGRGVGRRAEAGGRGVGRGPGRWRGERSRARCQRRSKAFDHRPSGCGPEGNPEEQPEAGQRYLAEPQVRDPEAGFGAFWCSQAASAPGRRRWSAGWESPDRSSGTAAARGRGARTGAQARTPPHRAGEEAPRTGAEADSGSEDGQARAAGLWSVGSPSAPPRTPGGPRRDLPSRRSARRPRVRAAARSCGRVRRGP